METVNGAVAACAAMAVCYVAVLYAPTVLLRLPPASSLNNYMIRRFLCVLASTAASIFFSASLLGIWRGRDLEAMLSIFGVRKDHMWQAAVFPLLLTSLLYAGSLVLKIFLLISRWYEVSSNCSFWNFVDCIHRLAYNVMAWRNYVVAPFTEEMVFRGCMIPLLLCGGYKTYNVIFFSPVFFSLAHLNHFLELYYQQNYSFSKAFLLIGVQLGYTVIFGCYASFLFIRTGVATIVFAAGLFCFFWLLFPASSPDLYNDKVDGCLCWHGYCNWS